MAQTNAELERITVRFMGDIQDYVRAVNDGIKVTENFSKQVQDRVDQTSKAFQAFGAVAAYEMAQLSKKSVGEFSRFDDAMTQSTAIMEGLTDAQRTSLKDLSLELSKTSRQGPRELAESYYFLTSAGFDVNNSMKLLPGLTQFATAGMFDMSTATTKVADAMAALGLKTKDAQQNIINMNRVTDVLVKGNILANANVSQLSASLTNQAGPALKVFKKDVEEGVAVLSAMADQGIKGEVAGNALARVLRLLSDTANKNSEAYKELGVRVFDPLTGKMRHTGLIIADLENAFSGMSDRTRAAALAYLGFETRVQTAILPLLGSSKAIMDYDRRLRSAGGTTAEVANRQMKSFVNQTKILANYVSIIAIDIGETLAPTLLAMAQGIKVSISWFMSLDAGIRKFVISSLVASGTVLAFMTSMKMLKNVSFLMLGSMGVIPFIIGTVISSLVKLVMYLYSAPEAMQKVKEAFSFYFGVILEKLSVVASYVGNVFGFAWGFIKRGVETTFGFIIKFLEDNKDKIESLWRTVGKRLQGIWNTIRVLAGVVWDYIVKEFTTFAGGLILVVGGAFAYIKKIINDTVGELTLDNLFNLIDKGLENFSIWLNDLTTSVREFTEKYQGLLASILATVAFAVGVYAAYKLIVTGVSAVLAVMSFLKITQAASIALWALWTGAVLTAKAALLLYNAQVVVYSFIINLATAATVGLSAAMGVLTGSMGIAEMVAFVGTVFIMGTAFIVAGAAVYAAYESVRSLLSIMAKTEGLFAPLAAVSVLFKDWEITLAGVTQALKGDVPLALDIVYTYMALVVKRFEGLWPSTWEFIKEGGSITFAYLADSFKLNFKTAISEVGVFLLETMTKVNQETASLLLGPYMSLLPKSASDKIKQALTPKIPVILTDKLKESISSTKEEMEDLNNAAEDAFGKLSKKKITIDPKAKGQIEALEFQLHDLLEAAKMVEGPDVAGGEVGEKINNQIKDAMAKIKELMKDLTPEAGADGEEAGKSFARGFAKGARVENVAFGSAEAIRRMEDYVDAILGGKGKGGVHRESDKTRFEKAKELDKEMKKRVGDAMGKPKPKIEVMGEGDERPEREDAKKDTGKKEDGRRETKRVVEVLKTLPKAEDLPSLPKPKPRIDVLGDGDARAERDSINVGGFSIPLPFGGGDASSNMVLTGLTQQLVIINTEMLKEQRTSNRLLENLDNSVLVVAANLIV